MELISWLNIARLLSVIGAFCALIGSWIAGSLIVIGAFCALIGSLMVWYLTNKIGKINKMQIESLQSENADLKKVSNLKILKRNKLI